MRSDCLQDHVSSQFKRVLRLVRESEAIAKPASALLAVSGGAGSLAMLELLYRYTSQEAREAAARHPKGRRPPLFDSIHVAYVAGEATEAHDEAVLDLLAKLCQQRAWSCSRLHLDDACDSSGGSAAMLDPLSPTSAETAREILRARALRDAAAARGCSVILSGDTSERLAIRTLRSIAEGQAWALGEMVGPLVQLSSSLHAVRPMSSISLADATIFCRLNEIAALAPPPRPGKPTVGSHVDRFVLGLADSFVSTVPSVNRIAGKLKLRSEADRAVDRCPLCDMPADPEASKWLAANATYTLDEAALARPELSAIERTLCFGCLVLVRDRAPGRSDVALPSFVRQGAEAEEARRAERRAEQRAAIADCLLDEDA